MTESIYPWGNLSSAGKIILLLFTIFSMALVHDVSIAGRGETGSVEAGEGIETEERFAKDVSAAPIQRQIGFAGLFLLSGYCLIGLPRNVRIESWSILAASLALLAWTLTSILWSTERGETAREFVRILVYLGTGMLVAWRLGLKESCLVLMLSLLCSVGFAVFVELAAGGFRPWSSGYRMQGSLHSNDLARQSLILAIGAYAYALRSTSGRFWWYVLIVAMAILYLSKSRTGLLTAGCGLICVRLINSPPKEMFGYLTMASAVLAMGLLAFSLSDTTIQRRLFGTLALGRKENVTSLTGRLPLWQEVWDQANGQSIFGFGYGAFWTVERTQDMGEELLWFPRHAHSIYLEMIVNLGFIGLAILLLLVTATLKRTLFKFKQTNLVEFQIFFCVIVAALVNGISEAAFVLPRDQGLFNSILIFAVILAHPSLGIGNDSRDAAEETLDPNSRQRKLERLREFRAKKRNALQESALQKRSNSNRLRGGIQ